MIPEWNGTALAASPRFTALWPVLACLPPDRAPDREVLSGLASARGVVSGGGAPVRFVPPDAHAEGYEDLIFATGAVATRDESWHDCFNALAWLAFPVAKAAINRLHREYRVAHPGPRGTPRDVLTLFDEDGLVLLVDDGTLADLLRAFRWRDLFVARRADVMREARFLGFGHALHEKLLAPFRGLTAKVIAIEVDAALLAAPIDEQVRHADRALAARLAEAATLASTRALAPLPVLGIPGWCAANEDPSYYDDLSQFRPGRRE